MFLNHTRSLSIMATFTTIALGSLTAAPAAAQGIFVAIPAEDCCPPEATKVVIIGEPMESAAGGDTCIAVDPVPVQTAVVIHPGKPARIVDVVVGRSAPLPFGTRISVTGVCNPDTWFVYSSSGGSWCDEFVGEID